MSINNQNHIEILKCWMVRTQEWRSRKLIVAQLNHYRNRTIEDEIQIFKDIKWLAAEGFLQSRKDAAGKWDEYLPTEMGIEAVKDDHMKKAEESLLKPSDIKSRSQKVKRIIDRSDLHRSNMGVQAGKYAMWARRAKDDASRKRLVFISNAYYLARQMAEDFLVDMDPGKGEKWRKLEIDDAAKHLQDRSVTFYKLVSKVVRAFYALHRNKNSRMGEEDRKNAKEIARIWKTIEGNDICEKIRYQA